MNYLAEDDRVTVARAPEARQFLSQPFFVAEVFTGSPGKYVKLEKTLELQMISSGELVSSRLSTWSATLMKRSPNPKALQKLKASSF